MEKREREKNIQYVRALNSAYQNRQLVIFYGAGLSKPLGLPDWGELVESILEQFMEEEYEDFDNKRDRIKQKLQGVDFWKGMNCLKEELEISDQELKDAIVQIISESEQLNCGVNQEWTDNNYKDLAKINVNLFLTTNYDKIFPKCLHGHFEAIDFRKNKKSLSDQLNLSGNDKKVIYLHGIIDDPSSIVISEDDVEDVYSRDAFLASFSTVLNSSKVLFIGVSFQDKFLRNFLGKIESHNQNAFYAMVLDKIDEEMLPVKQILVDRENVVASIRKLFDEISREVESIIIIRVADVDKAKEKCVKKCLSDRLNIFHKIKILCVGKYDLISFLTFKRDFSIKESCSKISEAMEELSKNGIIADNQFVCFISQNTIKVGKQTGDLPKQYKESQTKFLTELVSPDSHGFIIDKISLDLVSDKDKEWIQHFSEKKGTIPKSGTEYSLFAEEDISIYDSHDSGTEVHVAGVIFCNGKVALEKRNSKEASVPSKYSLPGGRVEKGETFRDALDRILKEKYNIIADNIAIVDEFKVHDANIPGLAYGLQLYNIPEKFPGRWLSLRELDKLSMAELACSKQLIRKAFELYNKKEKIKLRIIMLTDCVYNCRCCHHENIKEVFKECQIEKIENSLEILKRDFDIQQITITGGEPLLPKNRGNLLRLLSYIRNKWKKIDLSIITNAYFLDNKCIKELNPFNIRYKISLYGYNEESFMEYTRFKGRKQQFNYITDLVNKLKKLRQNSGNITLNIPLNKCMSMGLKELLTESEFQKAILDCKAEVKLIEMVKPRRGAECYEDDYVEVMSAVYEMGMVEADDEESKMQFNSKKYKLDGMDIEIYRYPCSDNENCKACFNNFALTLKPNGEMLICKKALEHNNKGRRIFSGTSINLENVDLGEEYGIFS